MFVVSFLLGAYAGWIGVLVTLLGVAAYCGVVLRPKR